MSVANIETELESAQMGSVLSLFNTPEGRTYGAGKTVGNGIEGWAPNAQFVHTDGGVNSRNYRNVGTKTTASWKRTHDLQAGEIMALAVAAYITLADGAYIILGTGTDLKLMWNGTYLECGSPLGMWCGAPSPADPQYHVHACDFFDDFVKLDLLDGTKVWVVAETAGGCTQAYTKTARGTILLTNEATTDNSGCQICATGTEPFLLAATKDLWFEARVKCAAGATEVDVAMGLSAGEDLTAVSDNMAQDGVVIHKDDGATTLKCTASKDGTNTGANANIGTMTTGWHTYGFKITGVSNIIPYFDGTVDTALTATMNDDEPMTPFFMVRNGDATTTQTLEIDYVKCVQLR